MNERRYDFELLRAFALRGDQPAFADLMRRHLDLVYGTAMRKVGDAEAAKEIAQDVFAVLARKAWKFGPDDSLPAWLHRTALLEAKDWLRREFRRRRREQTAADLGTTMKTPEEQPALRALVPMLDDALLSLREKDRTALLLRFYESRPLRELGATLGVSEDTAQKRVSGALEKLSLFFQRRGFKSATAAVAAAALEHTTASASAATATAVVNGVLHSAPLAAVGITAWLARLAGVSKPQLAAVCLTLAAVPVLWEWKRNRAAEHVATRIQAELDSSRAEQKEVETEIQRLSRLLQRREAAATEAALAATESAEAARKFEIWKSRVRTALIAEPYLWPDDSPFVRIPKKALSQLSVYMPVEPPGILKAEARELLGLAPPERAAVEQTLHNYFADVDRMTEAAIFETNRSMCAKPPSSAVASKTFVLPALGEAARESGDLLVEELKGELGSDRWPLVEAALEPRGTHTLRRVLGLESDREWAEVSAWITADSKGALTVGYHWASPYSSFSTDGASLASLLPGANLEGLRSAIEDLRHNNLPSPVTDRILAWYREQAQMRLGKESNP